MTLKTTMTFELAAKLATALDLQTREAPASMRRSFSWSDGVAASEADVIWTDRRTLALSATEDLDLAGTLTDAFGSVITFARVKALAVAASSGNTNDVVVGAATAAWSTALGATGTVTVRPGGLFVLIAPDVTAYAVTATSADILKVANSGAGTSVEYDIAIIGAAT